MNYDTIIVRYSELFLKSEFVRNKMERGLLENIRNGIKREEIQAKTKRERGRIFIATTEIGKTSDLLKHVFGVTSFSPAISLELKDLEKFVKENSKELIKGKTFAVRVNRVGTHDFKSQELAARLGEVIIDEINKKVDLRKPDTEFCVEIREQEVYVFTERIPGPGGMPLGGQGKISCFVDSREALVACWLMMKRGCIPVIYHTIPVDVFDKWSYGSTLRKIVARSVYDVANDLPLVVGDNLEKNGIKKYDKFETVLTPVVAFRKEEIDEFWEKINK